MSHRLRACAILLFSSLAMPACSATPQTGATGDFSNRPEVQTFIDEMVTTHGLDREELVTVFDQAQPRESIIAAMTRPAEAKPWYEYRPIFLTRSRIEGGVKFWSEHADILRAAEEKFAVDAQVIVAIIGVETRYGGNTGSYRVLDALSTLAFDYPPRAKFFRSELEQFLLLSREEDVDVLEVKGSYAGAMGYGQFISSSYRHYAVDFDNDGKRDLGDNPWDIIGSVANYLHEHKWELGKPVARHARVQGDGYKTLLEKGIKPATPVREMNKLGVQTNPPLPGNMKAALLELEDKGGPEYWVVLNNFYTITRYNRSPLYAMAVYQLSEEIRALYESKGEGSE